MRGNPHVRFGGRAEETDQSKHRHRASARSNRTQATRSRDVARRVHRRDRHTAEHLLDLLLDRIRSEETEGHEPLS